MNKFEIKDELLNMLTGKQVHELLNYLDRTVLRDKLRGGSAIVISMRYGDNGGHEKMVKEIYTVNIFNPADNSNQRYDVEFYRALDWCCTNIYDRRITTEN